MTTSRAALVGTAAWLWLLPGCNHDRRGDAFEREASLAASALTTPDGTKLLERGSKRLGTMQVLQTWDLRAACDWPRYRACVEEALGRAYHCEREGAALWCSRSAPGDVFRLSVERRPDGDVRAELRGSPD